MKDRTLASLALAVGSLSLIGVAVVLLSRGRGGEIAPVGEQAIDPIVAAHPELGDFSSAAVKTWFATAHLSDSRAPDPNDQPVKNALSAMGWELGTLDFVRDEQRLIGEYQGKTVYGPIVRLYTAPNLGGPPGDYKGDGRPVALLSVVPDANYRMLDSYKEIGVTATTVYCLILRHGGGGTSTAWSAVVIPYPGQGVCPVTGTETPLKGFAYPPALGDEPPSVGRLVERPPTRAPMIAIRCGRFQCILAATAVTARPPASHDVYGQTDARWYEHSWFDEQHLGEMVDGVLVPGPRASIIPVSDLESIELKHFKKGFVWVATIHLDKSNATYAKKHLSAGPNQLYLRFEEATGKWWGAIDGDRFDNTKAKWIPAKQTHTIPKTSPFPGVVRWKWSEKDEEIWVRCDYGCCEVDLSEAPPPPPPAPLR
jgi:hypothetical protein